MADYDCTDEFFFSDSPHMFLCRTLTVPSFRSSGWAARKCVGSRILRASLTTKMTEEERKRILGRLSPELRNVLESGTDAELSRFIQSMPPEEVYKILEDTPKPKSLDWSSFTDKCVVFFSLLTLVVKCSILLTEEREAKERKRKEKEKMGIWVLTPSQTLIGITSIPTNVPTF